MILTHGANSLSQGESQRDFLALTYFKNIGTQQNPKIGWVYNPSDMYDVNTANLVGNDTAEFPFISNLPCGIIQQNTSDQRIGVVESSSRILSCEVFLKPASSNQFNGICFVNRTRMYAQLAINTIIEVGPGWISFDSRDITYYNGFSKIDNYFISDNSNVSNGVHVAYLIDRDESTIYCYVNGNIAYKLKNITFSDSTTIMFGGGRPSLAYMSQLSIRAKDLTYNNRMNYTVPTIPYSGNFVNIGGRNYPYVNIGNQLWLAENLDYLPTGVTFGTDAFYYDNASTPITDKAGLLYRPSSFTSINSNLPKGWRIPTKSDMEKLINYVGNSNAAKLRSVSWMNGTDNWGFSAIPTGYYADSFRYGTTRTTIWTSTIYDVGRGPYRMSLDYSNDIGFDWDGSPDCGRSIRLVKEV